MISRCEPSSSDSNDAKRKAKVPIILITPPPAAAKAWDHYCTVTSPRPLSPRSNENSKQYGKRILMIGKELDCSVVNTYDLLGGDDGEEYYGKYLTDGLHLTEEGNRIVYDGMMDVLKRNYDHLLPIEDGATIGVPLEEKLWSELC
jgi:lysophospholipase L1-like esterase